MLKWILIVGISIVIIEILLVILDFLPDKFKNKLGFKSTNWVEIAISLFPYVGIAGFLIVIILLLSTFL